MFINSEFWFLECGICSHPGSGCCEVIKAMECVGERSTQEIPVAKIITTGETSDAERREGEEEEGELIYKMEEDELKEAQKRKETKETPQLDPRDEIANMLSIAKTRSNLIYQVPKVLSFAHTFIVFFLFFFPLSLLIFFYFSPFMAII
jgi:hypothetical protein